MRKLNEEELHSVTGGTFLTPAMVEAAKIAIKVVVNEVKDALTKDPET